jgi:hypothetical protein
LTSDRKIIGWSCGISVEETSLAAWRTVKPKHHKGINIFLTVQYASKKFTNVVDSYKIITKYE